MHCGVKSSRTGSNDDRSIGCAKNLRPIRIQAGNDVPAAEAQFRGLLHAAVITAMDGHNRF
jgi:hypothetical protein